MAQDLLTSDWCHRSYYHLMPTNHACGHIEQAKTSVFPCRYHIA